MQIDKHISFDKPPFGGGYITAAAGIVGLFPVRRLNVGLGREAVTRPYQKLAAINAGCINWKDGNGKKEKQDQCAKIKFLLVSFRTAMY